MVVVANFAEDEEHQVSCCCARMRADSAAHVAAIIYLILSVICLHPFGFAVALCVLFAKDNGSPLLYLPFLILHVGPWIQHDIVIRYSIYFRASRPLSSSVHCSFM